MGSYEDAEALRRSFLPREVRVLFVGESPPAGGTFFYAADSGLYRATRDAFNEALPELRGGDFLQQFSALGCYLDDLCHEPVNHLNATERLNSRRRGESVFAQTLRDLRPRVVVILLKAIAPNISRAAKLAGCGEIERHVLTYPSRWHRHRIAYRNELSALVRDFVRRDVLRSFMEK